MNHNDKKKKPEICMFCEAPVWDGVWVEGKTGKGETLGAIVCPKHVERAKKAIKGAK